LPCPVAASGLLAGLDAAITIAPVVEAAAGMATAGKACIPAHR